MMQIMIELNQLDFLTNTSMKDKWCKIMLFMHKKCQNIDHDEDIKEFEDYLDLIGLIELKLSPVRQDVTVLNF